jgi:hypothetical protein
MSSDCWSDQEYKYVLDNVKRCLWLYVHAGATIADLENAVENLTLLNRKEVGYLSTVHFLLSDEIRELIEIVPRILRRLSHSTQKEVIVNKACVKGKIDWNLTIKERCAQGYDQTIFVCRPPSRIYNLPENQLLKFVLTQVKRLIEETANLPKVEEKSIRLEELRTEDEKEKWSDRISWLRYHVNNALKNVHLREVDLPKQVNERMIRRAQTARNKDYETVEDSYSLHRHVIQKMDEETLRELIEKRILQPMEKDTLYELFVLFEVMGSLGKPEQINLIRPGAREIGTFKIGDETVHVYFQKVKGLFEESRYKQIFEDYELDVASRRPDITLYLDRKRKFIIIEVKRTKNRDYIVESVYKVLGYLADFTKYFEKEQKPKGVLVVWDIRRLRKTAQEISILEHSEVKQSVKEIICAQPQSEMQK